MLASTWRQQGLLAGCAQAACHAFALQAKHKLASAHLGSCYRACRLPTHLLRRCEPDGPRLRVALLLSGGVDSSLALRLLQAAGHAVTAFYLQIWFQEDFRNSWHACPWQADLDVARRVSALSCRRVFLPCSLRRAGKCCVASVATRGDRGAVRNLCVVPRPRC